MTTATILFASVGVAIGAVLIALIGGGIALVKLFGNASDFEKIVVDDVAQWLVDQGFASTKDEAKRATQNAIDGKGLQTERGTFGTLECRFRQTSPAKCETQTTVIFKKSDDDIRKGVLTRVVDRDILPASVRAELMKTNPETLEYDLLAKNDR